MVKFLIALAEMFSAFSAKLHDMSEDMPEQLTEDDVREIVQEEISTESIGTDDVVGLDKYVSDALDEYDASSKVDERLFYLAVQNLVWTYCNSRGIDTNEVYIHSEEWAMQRYLEGRAVEWKASVKEREERTKARIIREYEKHRQTVENAGIAPAEPTDSGRFVPTITLGDSTTTVDVKI
jgi:hypothetical protein